MVNKLRNIAKKFLKSSLFWILLVSACFQMFVYCNYEKSYTTPDSYSYSRVDYDRDSRTPIYPTFIRVVRNISGEDNCFAFVAYIQKAIYFLSIIVFYLTVRKITKKQSIVIVSSLLYGCLPSLFSWNALILTESFAIVLTTVIMYFTVSYFSKPSVTRAVLIAAFSFLAVMLRPAMLFLLPIFLVFWIIKVLATRDRASRLKHLSGLLSCILAIVLVVGYCFFIKSRFGFFGVSSVSNLNKTVMIVDSGIYAGSNDAEKVELIDTYGEWESYGMLVKKYGAMETTRFLDETIKQNRRAYIVYLAKKIISSVDDIPHAVYTPGLFGIINLTAISGILLPINFGTIYLIIVIGVVYIFYTLFKRRTIDWLIAFSVAFIFCNLFLSMFFAPFELSRLFVVSVPLAIVLMSYWFSRFVFRDKSSYFEERVFPEKRKDKKCLSLMVFLNYNSICNLKKHKNK